MTEAMEQTYTTQLRDRDPSTVEDLILDNATSTDGKIHGVSEKLTNLENLSLINCGLTTFEGLPSLPNLKRLDASDNKLSGSLDIVVRQCPELGALVLSSCKYADVESLAPLKDSKVETLDLFSNAVTSNDQYREKVFELIPTLKYLDGVNLEGEELDDSSDEDEDFHGEGDSDSGSEEDEGPGLSFLNQSQIDEEDDSEDYEPSAEKKTQKRKLEDNGHAEDEPEAKK